jgi:outer membrane protein assembly factor BamB
VTTAIADAMQVPRRGDWSPGGSMGGLSLLFPGSGKPPDANYQWKVICLDRSTGCVLREQIAREGKPPIPLHPNNTYATESPATDGKQLLVSFGMAGIYCYDLAGTLLWSKDFGTFPMQFDWGTGSSPVIYRDQVFLQYDNDKASFLVALDVKTGEERWRVDRDERSNWSTPFIWKNTQRTELMLLAARRCDPTSPPRVSCCGR